MEYNRRRVKVPEFTGAVKELIMIMINKTY